jgi:hypothetical protein
VFESRLPDPTAAATDATATAFRLVGGAATRFTSQLSVGDKISYVLDPLKSSEAKSSEAKASEAKASEAKSSKAADSKEACVWKVFAHGPHSARALHCIRALFSLWRAH